MKIAVTGTVPNNPPLQPMPDFVKPNISGNVNFDADQQAAKELEEINNIPENETEPEEIIQEAVVPSDLPGEYPKDYTGWLIGILLFAAVVLLAGWWWFFRRIKKRKANTPTELTE